MQSGASPQQTTCVGVSQCVAYDASVSGTSSRGSVQGKFNIELAKLGDDTAEYMYAPFWHGTKYVPPPKLSEDVATHAKHHVRCCSTDEPVTVVRSILEAVLEARR